MAPKGRRSNRRKGGNLGPTRVNAIIDAPLAVGVVTNSGFGSDSVSESGEEFLTTINVTNDGTSNLAGTLLLDYPLVPIILTGTRLKNAATNWQFYRFTRLSAEFRSASPTTIGGQVVCAFDPTFDVEANFASNSLSQVFALPGAVTAPFYANFSVKANCGAGFRQFPWFRNAGAVPDEDTSIQWRLKMLISSTMSGVAINSSVGWTVLLRYTCQFIRRSLDLVSINQVFTTVVMNVGTAFNMSNANNAYTGGVPGGLSTLQVYKCTPIPFFAQCFQSGSGQPAYAIWDGTHIFFWEDLDTAVIKGESTVKGFGGVTVSTPTPIFFQPVAAVD